jgi:hypothetical protein
LYPGKEISRKLIVARGDGAEVLELIEEALDEIAFAIKRKVARPPDRAVALRWDDWSDLTLGKGIDEWITS